MRIASLLASATEIVYALGMSEELTAVSHECDHPPAVAHKPRVTRPRFSPAAMDSRQIDEALRTTLREHASAYEVDIVGLREARPDLVLTQGVCDVCAVSTTLAEQAVSQLDPRPEVLSLDAHRVDDIFESIRAVGRALGARERARELLAELSDRVADVTRRVAGAHRPTVLALEWLDPLFVPGHWVPEMVDLAGGELLCGKAGAASAQMSVESVSGLDPDVLIIMPCGLDLEGTRSEAEHYSDRLRALAPRAVASGNAFVVDGSAYFSRSGPRFVTGVEILGALLHPDRCGHYVVDGRAGCWPGSAS